MNHMDKAEKALEYASSYPVRDAKDVALVAIANALVAIAEQESKPERIEDKPNFLADNGATRWAQMFGTPERAARTLEKAELETIDYCAMVEHRCDECRYEFDRYGCCDPTPLLEWLRGDA